MKLLCNVDKAANDQIELIGLSNVVHESGPELSSQRRRLRSSLEIRLKDSEAHVVPLKSYEIRSQNYTSVMNLWQSDGLEQEA